MCCRWTEFKDITPREVSPHQEAEGNLVQRRCCVRQSHPDGGGGWGPGCFPGTECQLGRATHLWGGPWWWPLSDITVPSAAELCGSKWVGRKVPRHVYFTT